MHLKSLLPVTPHFLPLTVPLLVSPQAMVSWSTAMSCHMCVSGVKRTKAVGDVAVRLSSIDFQCIPLLHRSRLISLSTFC